MLIEAVADIKESEFIRGGEMILWNPEKPWKTTIFLSSLLAFILFLFFLWKPVDDPVNLLLYILVSSSMVLASGLYYHLLVRLPSSSNIVLIANFNNIEERVIWNGRIKKRTIIQWSDIIKIWPSENSSASSSGSYEGVVIEKKGGRIFIGDAYINSGILCHWMSDRFPYEFFDSYTYHQMIRTGERKPQVFLKTCT